MTRVKFPTSLLEAIRYFADEDVCREFVASLRWPNGVRCVACDSDRVGFLASRSLYRCRDCRKQFSVRVGTIFEDSHIPLSKWMAAVWLLSAGKKSRSSHQLARDLKVSQKSAWFMAHRIRLAMETESFNAPLAGEVEADETYVGGKDSNKHPHLRGKDGNTLKRAQWGPHLGKVAVMGLLERHGEVRAKVIPAAKSRHVQGMVRGNVQPGSTLYTDAFGSYVGLSNEYVHAVIDHSESYVEGRVYTNGIENFWSLFKRVIYGTHHSVEPYHLDRYLAENVRKFNTRKVSDDDRFTDTVSRFVGRHITWNELTGKADPKGVVA